MSKLRIIFLIPIFLFCSCLSAYDNAGSYNSEGIYFSRIDVINDMFLPHEGTPAGLPDRFGWKYGPVVSEGKNIPKGWNAVLAWGQVYADEDLPNPDVDFPDIRVHIKDIELYIYQKDGVWKLVSHSENPSGASYVEDFHDDINKPADIKEEEGGGISIKAGSGFNFHYWTSRRKIDGENIAGVFAVCKARLIGAENYQTSPKYLINVGGDYWRNLNATYVSEWWTVCLGIANGRFKYVTPEWQYFTMHTFSKEEAENIVFPIEK